MSLQEAISRVQQAANASTRDEYGKQTKIMKEIHRLQLVAEKPDEGIMRLRWQFMTTFAIRFAIEYGIISAICEMSGEPLSAAELSRTTGAEELLIVRTMRLVTYEGVCEEVAHGVYAANAKTKFLALPGILNGFTHIYDFGYKVTGLVPELIRNGKLSQFPSGPDERSPMQHACGDTMFGILSKEPRRKKIFDDYMEARRYSKEPKWLDIFPADKLEAVPGQVLIVDVGGGKGHDLVLFRQRFPHMTGEMIVQDLPRTFASLAEKPQGITLMEHDFFTEQPVKGKTFSVIQPWIFANSSQVRARISCEVSCTTGQMRSASRSLEISWPLWTPKSPAC